MVQKKLHGAKKTTRYKKTTRWKKTLSSIVLCIGVSLYCQPTVSAAPKARKPAASEARKTHASSRFIVELGRGSGLRGLETVMVDGTEVTIYRMRVVSRKSYHEAYWQRTAFQIDAPTLVRLHKLVTKHKLKNLASNYSAAIHDGTQWILRIRDENASKIVYCDNKFPPELVAFSKELDLLLSSKSKAAIWKRVPRSQQGKHDAALWKSLPSSPRAPPVPRALRPLSRD